MLALAHSPAALRGPLRIFFELDARLVRIVAGTREPMLGQMRLAWWRDMLAQEVGARPRGDGVLDGIGVYWLGHEAALAALVDGWEEMLAGELTREEAERFGSGRAEPFAALARMAQLDPASVLAPARRWALVDAALHVNDGAERDALLTLAREAAPSPRLARPLRGLSVLDALARRSLARGGRPLMEGRAAGLVAARAAILGL